MPLKKRKYILLTISLLMMFVCIQPINVYAAPEDEKTEEVEVPEEEDTRLASLSVNDAPLMPGLSDNNLIYSVILPLNTEYVTIEAETKSDLSWIEGTGDFYSEGEGTEEYTITVYADNGVAKTYTIKVTYSDGPNLFVKYQEEQLGFVKDGLDNVNAPEGFKKQNGSYQGNPISVYVNESFPFSLIYLQNTGKKADWYCYQDGAIISPFKSFVFNKNKYYYAGVDVDKQAQKSYTFKEINVVGENISGWTVKDERYASKVMMYLYDSTGKPDYYVYDTEEQTLVNRVEFEVNLSKSEKAFWQSPLFIAVAIVVVIAIIFVVITINSNKQRAQKENMKAMKNSNNKGKVDVDHTVELVRTSKVRIYASPDQEKTSKPKELADEIEEPVETKVKPETKPIVKQEPEVEKVKPKVTEQQKPKVEKEVLESKVEKETPKPILEMLKPTSASETVEHAVVEKEADTTKAVKVKVDEPKKKEKKSHKLFGKKEKTLTPEKVKPKVKEPEIIDEKKPVEVEKKAKEVKMPDTPMILEEDPMNEIQKYIDQLFYSNQDKE